MSLLDTTQSYPQSELPQSKLPSSITDNITSFANTSSIFTFLHRRLATTEQYRITCVVSDVFLVSIICIVGFVGNVINLMILRCDPDKNNTANWHVLFTDRR